MPSWYIYPVDTSPGLYTSLTDPYPGLQVCRIVNFGGNPSALFLTEQIGAYIRHYDSHDALFPN